MIKDLLQNLPLRQFNKTIYKIVKKCETWCFPELCIICDRVRDSAGNWLCSHCNDLLIKNRDNRNACNYCGLNRDIRECSCDIAWDNYFEKIYSVFDYDDHVQELVKNIKYYGKKKLAKDLAFYLNNTEELRENFDFVTSVPLHWKRLQKRGYNQAEWFAKGVSDRTGLPLLSGVLRRNKSTGTQTKLDKHERRKNLTNAFKIDDKKQLLVKDKRILLADDVITTGATVAACTDVLLRAGCKSVSIISIARD